MHFILCFHLLIFVINKTGFHSTYEEDVSIIYDGTKFLLLRYG